MDANENLQRKSVTIADNDDETHIPGEASSIVGKEQLIVKLKYRTNVSATSPQGQRNSASSSPTGTKRTVKSSRIFPNKVSVVKQNAEDLQDTSSNNSKSPGPQTKIEKNGDDSTLALEPLNEHKEGWGPVTGIKYESEHDVHHQEDHPSQDLTRDEMNIDVHRDDDATNPSANDNLPNKHSDAFGIRAAVSELGKMQQTAAVEERGADDVNGDYQQTVFHSPQTAHGENTSFNDDDNDMSHDFDIEEWASAVYQPDADVASRFQEHQVHRAIDHQTMPPNYTDDTMKVQQEEQSDQQSQAFRTGQLEFEARNIQRHHVSADPGHLTNKSTSPSYGSSRIFNPAVMLKGFSQYGTLAPHYISQQPSDQHNQLDLNSSFDRQHQLQAQVDEKKRQLDQVKKLHEERQKQSRQVPYDFGYLHNQLAVPSSILTGPMSYQRAPQSGFQQKNDGRIRLKLSRRTLPPVPHVQGLPNVTKFFPFAAGPTVPPNSDNWMTGPNVLQGSQKVHKQVVDEDKCNDERNVTDDDEPLQTRVKRHSSVTSLDSGISSSSQIMTTKHVARPPRQDDDSEVEYVASKHVAPKVGQNPVRMRRPLPQPESSSPIPIEIAPSSSDNNEQIDWTLPRYDIQRQPLGKGEEIPSAKVSLPGLVREEVLLSPDHADEEVHLLINVFIPSQQALPTPDPEPAVALLNFHTIAVMIIEAYVQFEIGDEFGMGRGHFHQDHERGEEEYERMRDAVDADTNEIFFAVVDRYRAGLESKKKPLQLIRGTQEFCDVALDVIYYIKDHGLLRPEPKAKRARADKGIKRGPRAKTAAEAAAAAKGKSKGIKRGTAAKPNEVQPRKKAKTAPAVEVVKKKRSKPKASGVTVVRK
jgi:hypothetical protein